MFETKAQSSLEYLTIISFMLFAVGLITAYSLISYNNSIKVSQVNDALNKMKNSAENIYSFGPGSSEVITIILPAETVGSSIANNSISLTVGFFSGNQTIRIGVDFNVSGSIPSSEGLYRVKVRAQDQNIVFSEV